MAVLISCNAMILTRSSHHHPAISKLIESPHIAYTSNNNAEIFIIGTSHFSSNSANEVKTLISAVKPDGVVLELDPERCLRLTKQSCGFDASGTRTKSDGEVLYGADFLSAINSCQEMDVPLFLGDEYVQATKERLLESIGKIDAYSPVPLIQSLFPGGATQHGKQRARSTIDVIETFRRDPKKLTPLVVTTSPPFAVASVFTLFNDQHSAIAFDGAQTALVAALNSIEEIGAVVIASIFVSSLLFNNIIVERDKILAENTLKAVDALKNLKEGRSIRKRWKCEANTAKSQCSNKLALSKETTLQMKDGIKTVVQNVPLFTLKTPIQQGIRRHLNLFEPRWLKMIDQLMDSKSSDNEMKLGCVRCTNKFYSAISIDGAEGRYADVIFDTIGNLARVSQVKEGKRPVSGDRRLAVSLVGGDSFIVDESNLIVCDDGYMMASSVEPKCIENVACEPLKKNGKYEDVPVRIVVVVGLFHGNGVLTTLLNSSH
jgi:hypothetical protein